MPTTQVALQRFSLTSRKSFDEVVKGLTATIGRPDMNEFQKGVAAAKTLGDLERLVQGAIGTSGLMEFARFNLGEILRKESGGNAPNILRFVVGNPLIMKEMAKHVPDVGSYAPVTILVDEREDGVHLSYDSMASVLVPYGNPQALRLAKDLDSKIEGLMSAAAI